MSKNSSLLRFFINALFKYNEDTSTELFSNVREDSDDDDVCETRVMSFMNDVRDVGDDDRIDLEDNIHIDVWKESENKIRLRMQFESKVQIKKAVTLWSINHNREFKVYESKSNLWVAKCKTLGDEGQSSTTMNYTPHYAWYVRAIKKKNHQTWKITRWGSYTGKFLVAVTKDANNNILHVAYVIVDEESSHSWCAFG
uniref:Uncharacterized protein n=1 Tax=Lactuca sativa TaxID=4236 RepID=A0A9R1VNI5_LACSA|nr:hypothetical protein LSAT_V11C500281350 [Lactuca sativa]